MIVTVTASPAIDWTIELEDFELGKVNRIVTSQKEPSGKGVNISWALHRAGIPTRAVFPAGGHSGQFMAESLAQAGLPYVLVDTGREIRTNITLIVTGQATKVNDAGTELSAEQTRSFREAIEQASRDASTVLICGSLPPGMPDGFVRDLVTSLKAAGVQVILDSSGASFEMALEAGPDLIKPNVHELAELTGRVIRTFGDVVDAAQQTRARGAVAVLASLGADGAMLVDQSGVLLAQADRIPVINPVGAGDALLAGYVSGGKDRVEHLTNATLWATSAAAHPTTLFPIRDEFADHITVRRPAQLDKLLGEPSEPDHQHSELGS